jgi:hypothetical protein
MCSVHGINNKLGVIGWSLVLLEMKFHIKILVEYCEIGIPKLKFRVTKHRR